MNVTDAHHHPTTMPAEIPGWAIRSTGIGFCAAFWVGVLYLVF